MKTAVNDDTTALDFSPTDLKMNFVRSSWCVSKKLTRFLFCHRWTAWPTGIRTSWGSWQPCKLSPAQHSNRPWRIWRIPTGNTRYKSSTCGFGEGYFVVRSSRTKEYIDWRSWRNKKGVGFVHGSFGSEILRETICNTGPLPFKNLLGFEGSWWHLYSSQAQAKELDPWWFQQHCEQRGVDRHREQNRNNQHLKELVNFNRYDWFKNSRSKFF